MRTIVSVARSPTVARVGPTVLVMGVGTGGAGRAAAPPTFGTGEQAIALAPPKV